MLFVSAEYLFFLAMVCAVFYLCPVKFRKQVLILASLFFYWTSSEWLLFWLLYAGVVAYLGSFLMEKVSGISERKLLLGLEIILLLLPLIGFKWGNLIMEQLAPEEGLIVAAAPLGISFYTLSLIGYCVDIYRLKYGAEKRYSTFFLFTAFFPQIVQGPIARYDVMKNTLCKEHKFDYQEFCHGCQLILWGFFQKLVVADRLAVLVNHVFTPERERTGFYVVIACVMYSIQLYADFLGCVNIALGSAQLFGIRLEQNFKQPYFTVSIKDFWRRWHVSLSSWLRDYVYIPLGGNRNGVNRKRLNLMLVFAVSGLWHGAGFHYFMWGILHGVYQVLEDIMRPLVKRCSINANRIFRRIRMAVTFVLVTAGWTLFRAESISHFFHLMKNLFAEWNPGILFDGAAFELIGVTRTDMLPALLGVGLMLVVDILHEKNVCIRDMLDRLYLPVRWSIYVGGVIAVILMGIYGPGYSAAQFIYGNF